MTGTPVLFCTFGVRHVSPKELCSKSRISGIFDASLFLSYHYFIETRFNKVLITTFTSNTYMGMHQPKMSTLPTFFLGCNKGCKSRNSLIYTLICGEGGIRTPGASQLNSFQDCRNRPLYHLSYCFPLWVAYSQ